jgi:hypothetical protein
MGYPPIVQLCEKRAKEDGKTDIKQVLVDKRLSLHVCY